MRPDLQLTVRQRAILRHVVEAHIESREPVGSKTLVERAGLDVSASTVRAELAGVLERRGTTTAAGFTYPGEYLMVIGRRR